MGARRLAPTPICAVRHLGNVDNLGIGRDRRSYSGSMLLDDFVETCRGLAAGDSPESEIAAATRELMVRAAELREQVAPFTDLDPLVGADETVFEDDTVTIMVLDTPPYVVQPPHDHSMTAIIGVFDGVEDHRLYRRTGDGAVASGTKAVGPGETLVLGPEAIHAICAGGDSWARAIHVYLGPLAKVERSMFHPDSLVSEPFDLDRYRDYCQVGG